MECSGVRPSGVTRRRSEKGKVHFLFEFRLFPRAAMVILRFSAAPRLLRHAHARSFSRSAPKRAPPSNFKFNLSTAFHGKPTEADDPPSPRSPRRPKQKLLQGERFPLEILYSLESHHAHTLHSTGFAADSPIARWRDTVLDKVAWTAGHDFFFTTGPNETTQNVVIGIADGVGGWEDSGVDPSHFSQALMYHCEMAVEKSVATGTTKELSPTEIITIGFAGVTAEQGVVAGSSTACVITLNGSTGIMNAAK